MEKLKDDDWILSVKNEKVDLRFNLPLKMDNPRHQEIYGFVLDEISKILRKHGVWKEKEN